MLRAAHRHSTRHADEVRSSVLCGCVFCLEVFAPDEITGWIAEDGTALCPWCGIDAVIGGLSSYPTGNTTFLRAMRDEWF
ncbi:cytoplasmic protein [Methylobacterium sp. P31]